LKNLDKILGIDPGTHITGYGVIQNKNPQPILLACDRITVSAKQPLVHRLEVVFHQISKIIDQFRPGCVVVEEAFYGKNVKTILALSQLRGVILLSASLAKVKIFEYAPRSIKFSVTGNGAASKEQVQYMVGQILRQPTEQLSFDVSDALAIALCHAHRAAA